VFVVAPSMHVYALESVVAHPKGTPEKEAPAAKTSG
jgi:hypothetical protein